MKQRESGLPFDDIRNLAQNLPPMDEVARLHTSGQLDEASGILADLCKWYSASSGRSPAIHKPLVTLFAGTHELENMLDDGASSRELLNKVTQIAEGASYVSRLCQQHDAGLKVFDLALQLPVADISSEDALDEKSCAGTIAFGMEAIAGGADLLCIAALENTATLSAIAILTLLCDVDANRLLQLRPDEIETSRVRFEAALSQADNHKDNSLEVLRRLGGRETAAICGAILAARSQHIPVILEGATALAAAAVLYRLAPSSLDHCRLAQMPSNKVLVEVIDALGLQSVVGNSVSNDPTAGLVLGAGVIKSACLLLQGRT